MSTATLSCPGCRLPLKVSASVGEIRCPRCGTVFAPSTAADPQACDEATYSTRPEDATGGWQAKAAPVADVCLRPPQQPGELGRLGSYRVLKVLGQGGMGRVYQAEDTLLQRSVALKVLLPAYAGDDKARQRFFREARAAAALEHDNIIAIHQVGEDNGTPFLAMPLLKGESLEERLRRDKKLPLAEVLRIGREIAEGLAAAHENGLIHRDIKPGNLWLEGERARVKVLDFGLARPTASGGMDNPVTEAGAILGTPAYMAPEQARGDEVDARADLFSLGCVLYRMLTGQPAFSGRDTMSILMSLASHTPPPPVDLDPSIPPALSALVMRLLSKDREQRPPSARAVAEALAALTGNRETTAALTLPEGEAEKIAPQSSARSRRRRWIVIAAASGGLVAALVVLAAFFVPWNRRGTPAVNVAEPDLRASVDGEDKRAIDVVPPAPARSSPFDKLERSAIPARELILAGEGDAAKAPAGLVAVIGEAGMNHWRNVIYTGFRDDGKTLITASLDGLVRWWDVPTKTLKRSAVMPGLIGNVYLRGGTFDLSPDGKLMAGLEDNGKAILRRTDTLAMVKEVRPFWGFVAFSPDGKVLALTGAHPDGPLRLLDVGTLTIRELEPARSQEKEAWRSQPGFSPDGKTLALSVGTAKGAELRFYDLLASKRIRSVPTSKHYSRVIWHPSGKFVLASGEEGQSAVWDEKAEKITDTPDLSPALETAISLDGHYLIVGQNEGIRVWEWGKWAAPGARCGKSLHGAVGCVEVAPRGGFGVGGDDYGGVCLIRLPDGEAVQPASGRQGFFAQVAVTPDGRQVVRSVPGGVLTWHTLDGPRLGGEADRLASGGWWWSQMAFSPSGRWAAKVPQDDKVLVWDLAGRTLTAEMAVPGTWKVDPGTLSAAGDRLVGLRKDRSAVVVEAPTGKVQTQLPAAPEKEGEIGAAISPDGRWAAVTTANPGRLTVYDVAAGKPLRELMLAPSDGWTTFRWPMFAPDGKKLLCLSARSPNPESWSTGWLECWDTSTGRQLFRRRTVDHGGGPGLAIRPDARQAAWALSDGTVRLIDLDTGDIEQTLRIGPPGGAIPGIAYAPDGRHLVTANGNGTAYVLRIPAPPAEATDVTGSDWLDLLQFSANACEVRPDDTWVKRDETWTVAHVPAEQALMAFPVVPRGGYDLRAEVSLREGNDCLLFDLPVGPRSVVLGFNIESGTIAGLSNIGGLNSRGKKGNASTVKHEPLKVGKKITIAVSVRVYGDRAEVTGTADGIPPVRWSGPVADLSPLEWYVLHPGRLGIGTWQSRYTVHSLKFRRVDGIAKVYRPRSLPPAAPKVAD